MQRFGEVGRTCFALERGAEQEQQIIAGEVSDVAARQPRRLFGLARLRSRVVTRSRVLAREVGRRCSDLLGAYTEVAAQMNQITTASEFKGLIRHELDIEALLRTTLEFILGRSGPTNAAVFLPTTSGDYSLGAYVNYDCAKDTIDLLLDQLAHTAAPRFDKTTGLISLSNGKQLEEFLADDAHWLDESNVLGFCCRYQGEALAIVMLFRDRKSAYGQPIKDQLVTVGELFAAQLARVIHVHHRHLPKHKWGMLGDPPTAGDEDEHDAYGGGMAA